MRKARHDILAELAKFGKNKQAKIKMPALLKRAIQPSFVDKASDLSALLAKNLQAVHAQVYAANAPEMAVQLIHDYLHTEQLALALDAAKNVQVNPSLFAQHGINIQHSNDFTNSQNAIIRAKCGIAETGSLLLPSDASMPTLAALLPETVIILLSNSDILPYLETGLIETKQSEYGMPRALNLVTGPSKTGDIEQTIVFGAHGPIRLCVIIEQFEASSW